MNRVKQLVHAENVYRMGYTGKNIRVVTLDTGVYLHPDLRQNVVGFLDFVAMKRACYDDNGHGTHVGGNFVCEWQNEGNGTAGTADCAESPREGWRRTDGAGDSWPAMGACTS